MKRLIVAIFVSSLFIAQGASAQDSAREGAIRDTSQHQRPMDLSLMAYVPWWWGVGIGVNARFEIPVVPDGFIPSINDQFSIEPSLSFGYRRPYGTFIYDNEPHYVDIAPAVYATWSFHITPKFRPYAAIGLGYNIGIWTNKPDDLPGYSWRSVDKNYFYFDTAVGLFYNFNKSVAFRGELGAQGPKAGVSIFF